MSTRFQFHFSRSGDKQKVAQVRNTCSAQVRRTESHQCQMIVFVSGSCIIEAAVRIGAYLDSPERNLCTGINISITIRTDKRVHVVRQLFSLSHARQDTHQTRPNQKQPFSTNFINHIQSYITPVYHLQQPDIHAIVHLCYILFPRYA